MLVSVLKNKSFDLLWCNYRLRGEEQLSDMSSGNKIQVSFPNFKGNILPMQKELLENGHGVDI